MNGSINRASLQTTSRTLGVLGVTEVRENRDYAEEHRERLRARYRLSGEAAALDKYAQSLKLAEPIDTKVNTNL